MGKLGKFYRRARKAREVCGKGIPSQIFEAIYLRLAANKIGLDEYYEFELYRDDHYTWDQKKEFVGCRKENQCTSVLNAQSWNVITGDKLVGHAIFRGLNIPCPGIFAVFHPYNRGFPGAHSIQTPDALASYLRSGMSYPFFSKPAHGAGGRNSVAVIRYIEAEDSLELLSGERIQVTDYVADCYPRKSYPWEAGFLFQELVRPPAACVEAFGAVSPGFRAIVFNADSDPVIFRLILKIPTGNSMTDNFGAGGETGTIVAELDKATGRILRAQFGVAPDITEIACHPVSGIKFTDFVVPDWQEYLAVIDRIVRCFPGVRMQHWDIGLSAAGPIVYELNTFGGYGLPQIATRRGMMDNDFVSFLDTLSIKYPEYRKKRAALQ